MCEHVCLRECEHVRVRVHVHVLGGRKGNWPQEHRSPCPAPVSPGCGCSGVSAGRPRSWAALASRERRVPGLEGNRTAPFLQRRHVTARDTRTIRARGGTHRDVTRSQRTRGRHQRDGWRFTSSGQAAPPSSPSSAPPAPPLARDVPRWGAAVCLERPGPPLCLHDGPKASTPPATPGLAVLNPGSHSRRGGVSFFAASTWEIARRCFLRCPCSVFPLCPPSPSRGVCLWVGGDLTRLLETRPGNPAPGSVCLSRTDRRFGERGSTRRARLITRSGRPRPGRPVPPHGAVRGDGCLTALRG